MPTLMERVRNLFPMTKREDKIGQIDRPLPFVHLFGHEKTYGKPQPHDFARFITAYKSWAYACAWKNATSVAKNQIELFKERHSKEGMTLDQVTDHPFLDLIRSVNPFSNRFELLTITQLNLELTGNGYWWIPRSVLGIPYMIWNIPSHWVKVVPSTQTFVEGYVVQVPGLGKLIPFDEEEIVHFKFPSPFDMHYGSGPVYAAAWGLDLNQNIKEWGINFFLNNAQPSGVLTTEDSLSADQYHRLRDKWNEKYQGTQNAGKIALLESGLKFEKTGSTVKDTNFEPVTRSIRDEILAMFGVPASKLGLVEDVNRANAEANDYTYQKDTIVPRLTLIEEKLNEKFMPIYDVDIVTKFVNPVPEDKEFKLKERESNIRSGFSSIDEEREKEGLDPYNLPETSAPLIPFSMTPAGTPPPEPVKIAPGEEKGIKRNRKDAKWEKFATVTAPLENILGERVRNFFDTQRGLVMTNLNKFRSLPSAKTKDLISNILFSLQEADNNLRARTENVVRNSYVSGLTLGMADTGHNIDMQLFDPNISKAVDQRMTQFVGRVNETTASLLKEAVDKGVELGESIDEISVRVDKIYSFSRDFRSKRIAQTEVIGATNAGQLMSYSEAGVKRKEWLTARDEKVRASHQIDGQQVKVTDSFVTGDGVNLLYPGDRSGGAPAGEVINCRCTVLPIV